MLVMWCFDDVCGFWFRFCLFVYYEIILMVVFGYWFGMIDLLGFCCVIRILDGCRRDLRGRDVVLSGNKVGYEMGCWIISLNLILFWVGDRWFYSMVVSEGLVVKDFFLLFVWIVLSSWLVFGDGKLCSICNVDVFCVFLVLISFCLE